MSKDGADRNESVIDLKRTLLCSDIGAESTSMLKVQVCARAAVRHFFSEGYGKGIFEQLATRAAFDTDAIIIATATYAAALTLELERVLQTPDDNWPSVVDPAVYRRELQDSIFTVYYPEGTIDA